MNTIRLNTIGDSPIIIKKGSQVQSQEKTVEITENGTTEVVPDSGFSLSKVTVNTNVESSGSTMEYVAFNAETDLATYGEVLGIFAYLVKFPTKIETISLMLTSDETVDDVIAFAIDTGAVVDFMGSRKSIKDLALSFGADISLLPRITKEEFYSFGSYLVSIRDLHQPTSDEVDISAGVINLDNLSTVKEIDVVEPTVYEEDVTPTDIALYSTAKDIAIALMLRYTEDDSLRLIAIVDSTNSSVNTNAYILFSVNTDNTVQYDPDGGIQIVNDILASQDFKYIGEASGGELTEAQFDILDKYIKVKKA